MSGFWNEPLRTQHVWLQKFQARLFPRFCVQSLSCSVASGFLWLPYPQQVRKPYACDHLIQLSEGTEALPLRCESQCRIFCLASHPNTCYWCQLALVYCYCSCSVDSLHLDPVSIQPKTLFLLSNNQLTDLNCHPPCTKVVSNPKPKLYWIIPMMCDQEYVADIVSLIRFPLTHNLCWIMAVVSKNKSWVDFSSWEVIIPANTAA
jgi:hypothetical protein